MRRRHTFIAGAIVVALSLGLPALGSILPIYHVGWEANVNAYATVEGACGFVDEGNRFEGGDFRHLAFCFGDAVGLDAAPPGGTTQFGPGLTVTDEFCFTDEFGNFQCGFRSVSYDASEYDPSEFTYSVDPLLGEASVTAPAKWECSGVTLTLTADPDAEPSLRNRVSHVDTEGDLNADDGRQVVRFGQMSASVGRDADISGVACGADAASGGHSGRIMRGLGTTGGSAEVEYR